MRLRIVTGVASVLGTLAFASPAFADTKVVDDDKVQCPGAQFTSIQAAVDAAVSGDLISVCAGRYGPVRIPAGKQDLLLAGANGYGSRARACRDDPGFGDDPLIDSIVTGSVGRPAFAVESFSVRINSFTIRDALGAAGVELAGVDFLGFSNNVVKANTIGLRINTVGEPILNVFDSCFADNNAPGEGSGQALVVGLETSAYVIVERNFFTQQRSASVAVTGSDAPSQQVSMSRNQLVNDASIRLLEVDIGGIDDNVIRRSSGSAIVISGGDLVGGLGASSNAILDCAGTGIELQGGRFRHAYGNEISGCAGHGIFVRDVVTSLLVARNVVADNGLDGIRVANVVAGSIRRNRSENNGRDGLRVGATSQDIRIKLNTALGNARLDCHDVSTGSGSAGTANTWIDNVGRTDSPDGICSAP